MLPRPGIFSFSIFTYRVAMLVWALWLAVSLLSWVRWGWQAYSSGRLWDRVDVRMRGRKKSDDA